MNCIGCGVEIAWDGKGYFAYTCPCGATVFYDGKLGIFPPASLVLALYHDTELSHIDYYVGISSHESEVKKKFVEELRKKGAVWSWECEECREKFVKRQRMLLASGFPKTVDLHPDLKKAILGVK